MIINRRHQSSQHSLPPTRCCCISTIHRRISLHHHSRCQSSSPRSSRWNRPTTITPLQTLTRSRRIILLRHCRHSRSRRRLIPHPHQIKHYRIIAQSSRLATQAQWWIGRSTHWCGCGGHSSRCAAQTWHDSR